MDTLFFKVADLYFSIKADNANALKELLPSYAPFYVKKEPLDLVLSVIVDNKAVDTSSEGVELGQFDCGGANHGVYKMNEGYKIVISSIDGCFSSAMITNDNFSKCTVSLFGDKNNQRFGLGNAMMIAFAFSAAYYDTLLMHSSVTLNNGFGYLFLGKSGTGKSTHSSLWRKYIEGSDLLNDDNPAVRVNQQGEAIVYGTPWSGKTPCYRNMQVPVGAFLRLEQYPENIIKQEGKLQAFASILSSCSTMIWDKPSYQRITQTVEKVVKCTSTFYLKCRADEEAALLSHRTIAKQ